MINNLHLDKLTLKKFLKYTIAAYLGIAILPLFHLTFTPTIAVIAIIIIFNDTSLELSRSYSIKRILIQVLDVPICIGIYYIFINVRQCYLPSIPLIQVVAVVAAICVLLSSIINQCFNLKLSPLALVVSNVIIVSMMPANNQYPFYRIFYTIIGVIIGHSINYFLFSINHNKHFLELQSKINEEIDLLMNNNEEINHFQYMDLDLLNEIEVNIAKLREHLNIISVDIKYRKYKSLANELPFLEKKYAINKELITSLKCYIKFVQSKKLSEGFSNYYCETITNLYKLHKEKDLIDMPIDVIEFKMYLIETYYESIVLSSLSVYYLTIIL